MRYLMLEKIRQKDATWRKVLAVFKIFFNGFEVTIYLIKNTVNCFLF